MFDQRPVGIQSIHLLDIWMGSIFQNMIEFIAKSDSIRDDL